MVWRVAEVEHGQSELVFHAVLDKEVSEDSLHQFIAAQGGELGSGILKVGRPWKCSTEYWPIAIM